MKPSVCHAKAVSLFAALFAITGCKFGSDFAAFKDLKPGLQISNSLTRDPNKPQVLVYYANNPMDTATYKSERANILATLSDAKSDPEISAASLDKAAEGLENDFNNFADAVSMDIFGIKNSICSEKSNLGAGAVIISNDGIVQNNVLYCLPKSQAKPIPAAEMKRLADIYSRIKSNPIHEHSPLSHPDMLNASLEIVRSLFPTQKFEYSVVFKSHGNDQLAITPKIAYESRIITKPFLRDRFVRKKASPLMVMGSGTRLDKDGLEKDGLDKNGLDKDGLDKNGLDKIGLEKDGLDKNGLDKEGLDKIGLEKDGLDKEGLDAAGLIRGNSPEGTVAAGITKFQLLSALLDQERDLFFNVVFMESCRSDIGNLILDLADVTSPTIGMLYSSDEKGLSYSTLDWSKLGRSGSVSLRDWLMQELNATAAKSVAAKK
jgi:hypothetical protein